MQQAVARYRPGGSVSAALGLGADAGVRVWEIWNEPDHASFWRGGVEDYARMLKTAAIVIKTLDPGATVMFGGLLFSGKPFFLSHVLRIIKKDPLRDQYHWFFDVVAVHNYDDPWRGGWLTKVIIDTLAEYDIKRPIWLNETGVSLWNDYPGPVWASAPEQRLRLATTQQQAYFLVMSATFAWSRGADKVFYHQLYDDCGNQAPGSDFRPHDGELCSLGVCYGDAYGIYRNADDALCYSQHPLAGSPRPAALAYRMLATVFGSQPFTPVSLTGLYEVVTTIVFKRDSGERIVVVWNNSFEARRHNVSASGSQALAYFVNGESAVITAVDGVYAIDLKPASDFAYPDLERERMIAIGGEPVILVEWPI